MIVFRKCVDLGVPKEAVKIAADKVKYGIFPKRNATHTLLMALVAKQDFEGASSSSSAMVLTPGVCLVVAIQRPRRR